MPNATNHGPESPEVEFRKCLRTANLSPLWDVMSLLVTPTPSSPARPAHWPYVKTRPLLLRGGEIVSAEKAERRVLILDNPGLSGQAAVTRSLYAGLQLMLPGEIAKAHRHTQSALRFIVEGEGAYTTVDGERLPMSPGDLILTPAWSWHDHGNAGHEPVVWLDGLDVQIVNLLDASFSEPASVVAQSPVALQAENEFRYGRNIVPIDEKHARSTSPLLRYPYARTRETLLELKNRELCQWHGVRARFAHPLTGGWPLPTMGPFAQCVPAGFVTRPYRATDGTIILVAEGVGVARIGDNVFPLSAKDIFVVPSWTTRVFEGSSDLILLGFSDRPTQEKLELWREDRNCTIANCVGIQR